MSCHEYYGWIHWDVPTQSWHSVTGYQLTQQSAVPEAAAVPTADVRADGQAAAAKPRAKLKLITYDVPRISIYRPRGPQIPKELLLQRIQS